MPSKHIISSSITLSDNFYRFLKEIIEIVLDVMRRLIPKANKESINKYNFYNYKDKIWLITRA